MAEIDLIPTDYRNRVIIYGWGRRLIVATVLFTALSLAIYGTLEVVTRKLSENIAVLQNQQQSIAQRRDTLVEIYKKRDRYKRQWELLKNLRGGTAASRMFIIIDLAVSGGDVWFLNWEFRRAGTIVEYQPESVNTGYFVVLSDNKDPDAGEAWKVDTRMTIKGQAGDHSALSKFVRRLYEQPEVLDVRILNTSYMTNVKVVNFDMVVTVISELVTG